VPPLAAPVAADAFKPKFSRRMRASCAFLPCGCWARNCR
jgi:hypothetical protein